MKTVKITVSNHRHGAELVPFGTVMSMNDSSADWLIKSGKAELVPPEKAKESPTTK